MELPTSITLTVVALTVFFIFISTLRYLELSNFSRTRFMMTSFFFFIVTTLTISFWAYTFDTLLFTIPAWIVGMLVGYGLGVRAAQKRLDAEGLVHYMEHFAHIHPTPKEQLSWWSLINFYSVMSALVLINLVGFSTVIYHDVVGLIILTSTVGAFLLGTIIPYLIHLWSIKAPQHTTKTTNENKNA